MSKAAKRRAKKAITLPGGMTAPNRATGRDRRHTNQREEDPRMTVAKARLRHAKATPAQLRAAVEDRSYSDQASRCIKLLAVNAEQAAQMQHVVDEYRLARRAYRHAIGLSDSPKNAAIAIIPEELVVPANPAEDIPPMDDRSPEQRERGATRRWMIWQGRIGLVSAHDRALIAGGIQGELQLIDEDGFTTTKGRAFTEALRHWVDVIEAHRG